MAPRSEKSKHSQFHEKSAARLAAIQALFQIEQAQATADEVIVEFIEHRLGANLIEEKSLKTDRTFFAKLVKGAWDERDTLDPMLEKCLREDWTLERIESVTRAILRAGAFELLHCQDTPIPVIINEYLNLTRSFYGDKEVAFVNGMMDRLAKVLR